jgi:hypothetical protein
MGGTELVAGELLPEGGATAGDGGVACGKTVPGLISSSFVDVFVSFS